MSQPNPLGVALSIAKAQLKVRRPNPNGSTKIDHQELRPLLDELANRGMPSLPGMVGALDEYLVQMEDVDPDLLSKDGSLAFWLNLYNAAALRLTATTAADKLDSVLRVPGGFSRRTMHVGGEHLSLDAVEHGKIRRFGDPRIHGALVCGSISCPTLRFEPYLEDGLDKQLDHQMRHFLSSGGLLESEDTVHLSRVFLWYGSDFVRPHRMPTWIPARRQAVAKSLSPWMETPLGARDIEFQPYDWGLRCAVE